MERRPLKRLSFGQAPVAPAPACPAGGRHGPRPRFRHGRRCGCRLHSRPLRRRTGMVTAAIPAAGRKIKSQTHRPARPTTRVPARPSKRAEDLAGAARRGNRRGGRPPRPTTSRSTPAARWWTTPWAPRPRTSPPRTRDGAGAPRGDEIIVAPHRPLKPAPISTVTEPGGDGPLPRIGTDGRTPFEAYSQVTPLAVSHSDGRRSRWCWAAWASTRG